MAKNNKIVLVSWSDYPGGIELLIQLILSTLLQLKINVFVLRPKFFSGNTLFSSANSLNYGGSGIKAYFRFIRFIFHNKTMIYHVFNLGPFVLLLIRLFAVSKTIYSIHGSIYWKTFIQKIVRKIFWKLAIKDSMVFLANSEYARKVFLSEVSSKPNIKVVYNPFDTTRFNDLNRSFSETSKLKICYCGRLAEGKNLFKWIDTAEFLLRSFPEFEFNIFGEGPLRDQLSEYITHKKLNDKIKLQGFRADIENIYKEHDVMLFLSKFESFGNVAVESILCGTPVIASKIPAMEEIFNDYPQFLVPLDNHLFENTLKKINNYQSLKQLTSKAAWDFKVRFSLEKHILELEKIYNSFE